MALMKQNPKKKKTTTTKKTAPDPYKGLKDAWGKPVGGPGNVPPFETKKATTKKK